MKTAIHGKGGNGLQGAFARTEPSSGAHIMAVIAGADRHNAETEQERELRLWSESVLSAMVNRSVMTEARINIRSRKGY